MTNVNDLLPFLLKRENIARYEDGVVHIGNRKKFPFEKSFVHCPDVESVAIAIETMVTQGGGPWIAAIYALAGAMRKAANKTGKQQLDVARQAVTRLRNTRPTNTGLTRNLDEGLQIVSTALTNGQDAEAALLHWVEDKRDRIFADYERKGRLGADLIEDGDRILTMCFAEHSLLLSLAYARAAGKQVQVYTPETRPYLQGARLTAPSIHEIGIPVTLIGDSMPAHLLSEGCIQIFMTAADVITLDGHVVNKIGTYQLAIAAHYHQVPFYPFAWGQDWDTADRNAVEIEYRDPAEMKSFFGKPTTLADIPALYPAFDITPPELVRGVITSQGILSPFELKSTFGS